MYDHDYSVTGAVSRSGVRGIFSGSQYGMFWRTKENAAVLRPRQRLLDGPEGGCMSDHGSRVTGSSRRSGGDGILS